MGTLCFVSFFPIPGGGEKVRKNKKRGKRRNRRGEKGGEGKERRGEIT